MNWLLTNWHHLFSPPWAGVALAFAAVVCGAIVGAERERKEKPAGMRTMTLVCLGAAVFTMISFAVAGEHGDRGRIAAQIVTGVGFLGAGAILRGALGVTGLTTAATIWAVAAIGMVVGAGYAVAGLMLSLGVLTVLTLAATLEQRYLGPCTFTTAALKFEPAGGKTLVKIEDVLDDYRIAKESRRAERLADGMMQLRLTYCNAHKHHKEFLTRLAAFSEVQEIRWKKWAMEEAWCYENRDHLAGRHRGRRGIARARGPRAALHAGIT